MTILDKVLLLGLAECGVDFSPHVRSWGELVDLLAAFDAIGRSGSNAILKVDGGRGGEDVYTVVISGGRLGQEFFRKDGADLGVLLGQAVAFFIEHSSRTPLGS